MVDEVVDSNARGSMDVLVVQPDSQCDSLRVGSWLEARGARLHVVRPFEGNAVPCEIDAGIDGVVVLGGAMAATDHVAHAWIEDVEMLLRAAIGQRVPTLGICLGAQILAQATGGRVARSAGLESGLVKVEWTAEAANDQLMSGLPSPMKAASMHFDAVERLPAGAVHLASSSAFPHQAFRVGECAWGVQFHPEISPERFDSWRTEVEHTMPGGSAQFDSQVRAFEQVDDEVAAGCEALTDRFAQIVRITKRGRGGVRLHEHG